MKRPSSIVLLSGGLDSLASFYWALERSDIMMLITFDYGQKAFEPELKVAQKVAEDHDLRHETIELSFFKDSHSALLDQKQALPLFQESELDEEQKTKKSAQAVWVPNRNGVFINIAACIAENRSADWIVIGFNAEEAKTFPDNSEGFLKASQSFLSFSTMSNVEVKAPMVHKNKKEIVEWCLEHQLNLKNIWSCYLGAEKMCGQCESCHRLKRAFKETGQTDLVKELF